MRAELISQHFFGLFRYIRICEITILFFKLDQKVDKKLKNNYNAPINLTVHFDLLICNKSFVNNREFKI
jgi:hypothetical protein